MVMSFKKFIKLLFPITILRHHNDLSPDLTLLCFGRARRAGSSRNRPPALYLPGIPGLAEAGLGVFPID